jgi:hypothetical protein
LYDDVYAALSEAGVRFVVVGGTAVALQGYARLTVDLDLVIDLATEQVELAITALSDLGFTPRLPVAAVDFADPEIRETWVREKNLQVFSLYDPDNVTREVDLFAVEPLPFEELLDQATKMVIAGAVVPVASRQHLIDMKRRVGRPQDLADVAALEELSRDE